MAGFKIIRDYYHEREMREYGESLGTNKGKVRGDEKGYQDGKVRCKVYDDDGILYYEAMCDGEAGAEMFHDWGTWDSGTVASKIKMDKDSEWEWFIG